MLVKWGQVRVYSAGLKNKKKNKTEQNRTKTVKKETLRIVHVVKGSEYGTFGPRW